MSDESRVERNFWRYWLGGLLLLAMMIAMNAMFVNSVSPWGIGDHQSADSAARIDTIQTAWQAAGVMQIVRLSMALDFVFIAVYSFGAYCGGRMFQADEKPALRRLGFMIVAASIIFCATDYIETVCQFIQAVRFEGSDLLAGVAATVQPIKSVAFLISCFGIITALFIRQSANRIA